MKRTIYITDSENRLVFSDNIKQHKNSIVNQMVQQRKHMKIYNKHFIDLVEVEDIEFKEIHGIVKDEKSTQ